MIDPVDATTFGPGDTIVRRDASHGRLATAQPMRVIEDTGDRIVSALWPGVTCLGPDSWVEATATGSASARERLMDELGRGTWTLAPFPWMRTVRLSIAEAGRHDSTVLFFDQAGELLGWYVNVEVPFTRTGIGFDTCDLGLDLVVAPDLSTWRWKDEDEYAHLQRLGAISTATARAVDAARDDIVARVESHTGPFAEAWDSWRPDPAWPNPQLPANVQELPIPRHLHEAV